jgi:hypothetical protein
MHRVYGEGDTEHREHQGDITLFASENQHLATSTNLDAYTATDVPEDAAQFNQLASVWSTTQQAHPSVDTDCLFDPEPDAVLACFLPGGLLFPRPTDLDMEALKTFPFLRKLASADGLGNVFECGDLSQRSAVTGDLLCASNFHFEDLGVMHDVPLWLNLDSGGTTLHTGGAISDISDELVNKAGQIIASILQSTMCDQVTCKRNVSRSRTLEEEKACELFFSPQHLQRYLSLYWSCWHPNWPVMHKPSFSAITTSPALVAAMAVIGACLSTMQDDRALARLVFDAVEDAVFNDETFSSHQLPVLEECPGTGYLRTRLEILLAAYCVCLYQNWEGGKRAKRRVHRQRYGQLISVNDLSPTIPRI